MIDRIDQVEEALTKAQLQLGGSGRITDINHNTLPKSKKSITGVTDTMALIVRASKIEKIKDEDIILDPIFPIDKLMEQQNETVNTTMEKPKLNNTAGINNEDQPKGNVSTEALQETNSGLDLKSSLKKQPIIRVAFPRSVPTIKDIRRRRRK